MTAILKVDTIQDTSGNNIINENANTITIGKSGDTVNLASGATAGFGKVLQVVSTNMDVDTTTTSGSYVAVTNFEVNITPSSTSSKVFVLANWGAEQDTSNGFGVFTLYKNDTTDLGNGSYGFGIQSATGGVNRSLCNIMYLDSPNTTSSTNYQIYFRVDNGGTVKVSPANARCTITAMEIGA